MWTVLRAEVLHGQPCKDGLPALTGKACQGAGLLPTPGIDFSGIVERSEHAGFAPGDRVILNGWGLGETHHGGFAQRARVKGDWLIKAATRDIDNARWAMAIGTAGCPPPCFVSWRSNTAA